MAGIVSTTATTAIERQSSAAALADRHSLCSTSSSSICCFNLTTTTSMGRASKSGASLVAAAGAAGRELYQPFRPPSAKPASPSSIQQDLETLRDRRGVWHEYAALIPGLLRSGYSPSQLDEATGITGVEQNQLVVASQVRGMLLSASDELAAAFDYPGGAALLYELRYLSAQQRVSTAAAVVERGLDPKGARELARAVKDFDRRKRDLGWDCFSASSPGDCLAFWWYRQSKESNDEGEKQAALRKGLEFASTESAKSVIAKALGSPTTTATSKAEGKQKTTEAPKLNVFRLQLGETSGLVILPLADAEAASIREAPGAGTMGEGPFRIQSVSKAWSSWVPLPGWTPILEARSPLAVRFSEGRSIKVAGENDKKQPEETLLIIDKGKPVEDESLLYLVASPSSELSLKTASECEASDAEVLGAVLLGLSPPKGTEDHRPLGDFAQRLSI